MTFRQKITLSLLLSIALCLPLSAQQVEIPDPNLRAAVRVALNLPDGVPITQTDMHQLTKLESQGKQIKDLSGLEHAVNITWIDFGDNQITSPSPLAALTRLEILRLGKNPISDLSPIAELTQLNTFYAWECQIFDISPLANLTQVAYLDLSYNRIVDIGHLVNLTRLFELVIRGNEINDVTPLAILINLNHLELQYNRITDVTPLENLTNLEYLDTQNNPIFDPDSPLVDVPDPNLRAAIHKQLRRPEHLAIDRAAMLQLNDLSINGQNVTCLVGLEYAKNLVVIDGFDNPISDLRPLANLPALRRLYMWRCEISDLRPLTRLLHLIHLDVRWNRIIDITPLSELTQLIELALSGNEIEDVTPLSNLSSLRALDVTRNKIGDHSPLDGLSIPDLHYDQTCDMPALPVRDRIENRSYPSIFARWSGPNVPPISNRPELSGVESIAQHDLWFSTRMFGLRLERWPANDIRVVGELDQAIQRRDEYLAINPNMIFLINIRMRNGSDSYLPEDSPHWIRDGQGNIVEDNLMDFTHPYVQDIIINHVIAVSKCGLIDGIIIDWWAEHSPILRTPSNWGHRYRTNEAEQRARDSILQRIRAGTRPDFLIMGNTNHRIIPRTGPHINGGFMEVSIPGTRSAIQIEEGRSGLPVVENSVRWLDQNLREPRISGLEGRTIPTEPASNPTNRRWMRAITTLSLTHSDGYVLFSEQVKWTHDWYDFWDADLGRPVGEKGQLYQGTDGLYIREFTNGWAVYNHSGSPQVIRLPEEAQGVASGLVNVEHALPNLDGEMYLKTVESGEGRVVSKNPADVNGDGVVNILDLTLVAQTFGTDKPEGDVNGDGVINVFDLAIVADQF